MDCVDYYMNYMDKKGQGAGSQPESRMLLSFSQGSCKAASEGVIGGFIVWRDVWMGYGYGLYGFNGCRGT